MFTIASSSSIGPRPRTWGFRMEGARRRNTWPTSCAPTRTHSTRAGAASGGRSYRARDLCLRVVINQCLTNCFPSSRCLRSRCWESCCSESSVEQNCPEYRMNLCSSRYCLSEQSRMPPRVIQGLRSGEYASSLCSFLSFNAVCDKWAEPRANAVVSPSTPLKRVKRS